MNAARTLLAGATSAVLLGLLSGCRSAPPPAAPAPVPVTKAATAPVPAQEVVQVTASTLNVRQDANTSAAVVTKVKKGERLVVLGRDDGWVHVLLPAGGSGWVSARYVRSEPACPADKPDAELLSDVPLSFSEGTSIGKVVVEATVDATGSVASTRVVSDTTGIPELVQRAESEVRTLKFSPPVRNCRPVPFVYTYTRYF
jgi:TonB family protein